jgi:chloramphenicol-sensitive protein RarD
MKHLPQTRGLAAIILAYAIWGLFPVYWKVLGEIASIELLYTRLILTALACLVLLPLRGTWKNFRAACRTPRHLKTSLLAALLLSGNWFAFIWAVNNGRVLESSLGYFLCPLVSVILGRFIEQEKLGTMRWLSVGLAACGVAIMVFMAGRLPLAAIAIAFTWSGYGLIKKRSALGPVVSLGLETSLLAPLAAVALLVLSFLQPMSLGAAQPSVLGFLAVSGFLTAAPLLLFAYAAPRIRLSTMGMGQYIVPSTHFALGIFYGETVTATVLTGFALIWLGLAGYSLARPQSKTTVLLP